MAKEKGLEPIPNFQNRLLGDFALIKDYVDDKPFIVIEKVILGYRYTEDDLRNINKIRSVVENKLKGMLTNFELSKLSHKFYNATIKLVFS